MKKMILFCLSLIVISMFLVGCGMFKADKPLAGEAFKPIGVPQKFQKCVAGWVCKDASNKAYQSINCALSQTTFCPNGCSRGICLTPISRKCVTGWICTDDKNKAYQSINCALSPTTSCPNGCLRGICNPACTGTAPVNAVLCAGDNNGLAADTQITLVAACGTPKCEYTCTVGYHKEGGACVVNLVRTEYWNVGTPSNKYEIANSNSPLAFIKGETLRDIASVISKNELSALSDGTYSTSGGNYNYQQSLSFESNNKMNEIVKYTENNQDITADFFYVKSGVPIAKYKLEFMTPAESKIDGTKLTNFEGTSIKLFGKDYTIVSAERQAVNNVVLTLTSGTETMILMITINGIPSVNGLKVNGNVIDGAFVIMTGTDDGVLFKIKTIQVEMIAQDDYFVGSGKKLSEAVVEQGDRKELLFTSNWDIEYLGLTEETTHDIKLFSPIERKYSMVWYDGDNNKVIMPLAYVYDNNLIVLGEEAAEKALILKEGLSIKKDDYFVVTGGNPITGTAKSYLLQYKGEDRNTQTSPKIQFKNLGSGETLEYAIDTSDTNTICTIKLAGNSFVVENISSKTASDFGILVDLNGDNSIRDYQVPIIDYYGAQIILSDTSNRLVPLDSILLTINTPNADDYDNQEPSTIKMVLDAAATNKVTLSSLKIDETLNPLFTPESEENVYYGYTSMGGKLTYQTPAAFPHSFTYSYPKEQRLPQVKVSAKVS